jgi:cysteine synthase
MFLEAERNNRIKPGDTIIEATSGNTGYNLQKFINIFFLKNNY